MRQKAYAVFLFLFGLLFAGAGGDLLLTLEKPEVIKNIGNIVMTFVWAIFCLFSGVDALEGKTVSS